MSHLQAWLAVFRNFFGSQSSRTAGFWLVTAAIALLIPSPIAAPILLARLHRHDKE